MPLVPFYNPCKQQKISGFLMASRDTEKDQWLKMCGKHVKLIFFCMSLKEDFVFKGIQYIKFDG